MSLNKSIFSEFFPSIDRFSFQSSLVWVRQQEIEKTLPAFFSNPLNLNYEYMCNFRPECVGSRIPGLVGGATFIHDGQWKYNIEKNSYHVRCLAVFICANLFKVPPLSNTTKNYTLEIGFAFVDPTEVLLFAPPIHFKSNIKRSTIIWILRRRISLFINKYQDPRLVRGISLFVVYNSHNKREKLYWKIKEIQVNKVLDIFGVTPPVFRGYRLGRDGKLIIPAKPSKKNYPVQIPKGIKPFKKKRISAARRRKQRLKRQLLEEKIKEKKKLRARRFRVSIYKDFFYPLIMYTIILFSILSIPSYFSFVL